MIKPSAAAGLRVWCIAPFGRDGHYIMSDRNFQEVVKPSGGSYTLTTEVIIPLCRALVPAVLVVVLAAWFGLPWRWAALLGLVVALAFWFYESAVYRQLLVTIERRTVNGRSDEAVRESPVHKVDIRTTNRQTLLGDLPVPVSKMKQVAAHVSAGGTFSRKVLCTDKRLISQGQYRDLLAFMDERGMIERGAGNRISVRRAGRAFLMSYL